jgi:hypothetical protein
MRIRWVGQEVRMGEMRNKHRMLVGSLRKDTTRNTEYEKFGKQLEDVGRIHLAQDRNRWLSLVNNLRVPKPAASLLTF